MVPARLCLRSGFLCFNQIARAMGIDVPDEPDPNGQISLSYQEFLDAVARMREVDFPIEREPAEAWPDFVGWRLNYEQAAYAVACRRRRRAEPCGRARVSADDRVIPPIRPPLGRQQAKSVPRTGPCVGRRPAARW